MIDRVDRINGQLRIIDYKTGKVTRPELKILEFDQLLADYKYSKGFQVLAYSLLYLENNGQLPDKAGLFLLKTMPTDLCLWS